MLTFAENKWDKIVTEECNAVRPSLPPGPWQDEIDRMEFEHEGFPCLMSRNPVLFHWCGYVAVPPGHPCHGKSSEALGYLRVHGGVTYTGLCHGPVCHVPKPGRPDNVWWIGFDCGHAGDLSPGAKMPVQWKWGAGYVDQYFVIRSCEHLAEQLLRKGKP